MVDKAQADPTESLLLELRRGVLVLGVLAQLRKDAYGYALKRALGVLGLDIDEGTLYPLLSRLRVQGLVSARLEESSEGPARKYYALTEPGRAIMKAMNEYLDNLSRGTRKLQERSMT